MTRRLAAAFIAAFIVLIAAQTVLAQNPFRPSSPAPEQAAPKAEAEPPSLLRRAFAALIVFQRTMVRDIGRYMAAIRDGTGTAPLVLGIGFAFLYGVVHTLGPGHGKTIVASYFVGHDARIARGLMMGLQIAVTHVISAIVLVWLVDLTFRQMLGGEPAESWWIRLVSFSLIAVVGLVMLVRAIHGSRTAVSGTATGHDHDHAHGRHQQGALAVLAGLVPCTGAILVMLFALANGIILAGVLMVAAISAGMAAAIATVGMASILFRRALLLFSAEGSRGRVYVSAALEYAAALLILTIGLSFVAGLLGERFA